MAVLRHTGPNHRSIQRIQRREESRRPIAFVVVGHGASTPWDKRKSRLGSVQRLDLALLVNREDQRVLRRVHIQSNDVVQLFQELRIPAHLEGAGQVRLEAVTPPDSHQSCSGSIP